MECRQGHVTCVRCAAPRVTWSRVPVSRWLHWCHPSLRAAQGIPEFQNSGQEGPSSAVPGLLHCGWAPISCSVSGFPRWFLKIPGLLELVGNSGSAWLSQGRFCAGCLVTCPGDLGAVPSFFPFSVRSQTWSRVAPQGSFGNKHKDSVPLVCLKGGKRRNFPGFQCRKRRVLGLSWGGHVVLMLQSPKSHPGTAEAKFWEGFHTHS